MQLIKFLLAVAIGIFTAAAVRSHADAAPAHEVIATTVSHAVEAHFAATPAQR